MISVPDSTSPLLFKDKQSRLLLALNGNSKEWYISDLARETGVTYIHATKFIARCEEAGIIESEKHGRLKRIFLTEKGKSVAASILSIMNKISEGTAQQQAPAQKQQAVQPSEKQ